MNLSIRITQKHHDELMNHLHSGDGLEAVAFALCGTCMNNSRLLVNEIIPIPYDQCTLRTIDRVTWKSDALKGIFEKAEKEGFSIIKFHSHPEGAIEFSEFDDFSDQSLFPRIYDWLNSPQQHSSVIVTPQGNMVGRHINKSGDFTPIESIVCIGADIKTISFSRNKGEQNVRDSGKRVAQTFGPETFNQLGKLKIAVVGCSGTGSPVIEQLARTCVGELVLIDPDVIDEGNLNRITNSTLEDARQSKAKVKVLKEAVEKIGLGTKVHAYQCDIFNPEIVRELSSCDIIFGCMDSVDGRHLLNKLATYYLIPYFDTGVKLVADGKGGISKVCGQVHYLQPGRSSLFSRKVYTMDQLQSAALFRTDPEAYYGQKKSGYIDGVNENKPAVVTLNTLTSSLAVADFLSRIHRTRGVPSEEIAVTRFTHDQALILTEPEPEKPCSMLVKKVGLGDRPLLLDTPELSELEIAS